jgi:hypothetical protein
MPGFFDCLSFEHFALFQQLKSVAKNNGVSKNEIAEILT